jgi:rhodanese-related sulfurtransferase
MPVTDVTIVDALQAQRAGATYIDVRSSPEFAAGHPSGAINVPLLEPDEDTGQLMPNPDFVRVMKSNFPPDAVLLLGCQSGARGARAAQMLETFGFTKLSSVTGGFQAWVAAGLATATTAPAGKTYDDLVSAADAKDPT